MESPAKENLSSNEAGVDILVVDHKNQQYQSLSLTLLVNKLQNKKTKAHKFLNVLILYNHIIFLQLSLYNHIIFLQLSHFIQPHHFLTILPFYTTTSFSHNYPILYNHIIFSQFYHFIQPHHFLTIIPFYTTTSFSHNFTILYNHIILYKY